MKNTKKITFDQGLALSEAIEQLFQPKKKKLLCLPTISISLSWLESLPNPDTSLSSDQITYTSAITVKWKRNEMVFDLLKYHVGSNKEELLTLIAADLIKQGLRL